MTTILKKSVLTLSITAILVAGIFVMSPILVDADKDKKQTCPAGKVVTGIDRKGDIICSALPSSSVIYHSTDNTVASENNHHIYDINCTLCRHCTSSTYAINSPFLFLFSNKS